MSRRDGKNESYIGLPYSALKRTPTIQRMVRWGYVESSLESNREELRIDYTEPVPGFCRAGICLMCGSRRMVNSTGNCVICWNKTFSFLPPEMETPKAVAGNIAAVFARADIGALFDSYYASVNPSSWKSDKAPPIGVYYSHNDKRVPPVGATRPWQRYRWQIQDQWWPVDRHENKYRLHPRTDPDRRVSLRCLVCLRVLEVLQLDQVCPDCHKDWRKEKPEGVDYERWVVKRRAFYARHSKEHLAAYIHARIQKGQGYLWFHPSVRPYFLSVFYEKWYNSSRDISDSNESAHG